MQKRVLLLTGTPGVGKTTVVFKTVEALKAESVSVGGMISREAREGNVRIGFEIIDLSSKKHGWLAHVNQTSGPQVGKYHVNLEDLEKIGAKSIIEAVKKCSVVAIDEIGPMELYSQMFNQAVEQALMSKKLVFAVVHAKTQDPLISLTKQRDDAAIFVVTLANRDSLPQQLAKYALEILSSF